MFHPGQIIYFNEFFFKNGNTSKPKYFIILANIEEKTIIATLPTRTNLAPSFTTIPHGCINHDDRCYNCYVIGQGKIIGEKGFSFPLPTYIYGDQVEDYEVEVLEDVYKIEGVDFVIEDLLKGDEFNAILACLLNSTSVKRKIKKFLETVKKK